MRKTSSAVLATALTAIVLALGVTSAQAQRRVQLIDFTTTSWRYFTNGTDLGRAWRARTYPDSGWPSGPGLLGVETTPANYPYPFNTMFPAYDNNIITYYFRAHFNMSASDYIWPLTLVMSNLVDDGCVVYLNSNQVAAIRVPTDPLYTTVATGGPAVEGAYEPTVNPSTNGLLVGDNVIAVEVHQVGTGSSDIVNGLSLTAIVPTTLSITSQPPSTVSTTVGMPFTLSAGVSGGPGLYQWQTNNGQGTYVNIPLATNSVYTATPLVPSTVIYRVVVSNGVNTVISSTSTVTTAIDTSGPIMLSADVLEEANQTNRILIVWNEKLTNTTVCPGCGTNFTVVMVGPNTTVTVSNVLYNPSGGPPPNFLPITRLTMSTTNWNRGSNYYIRVNNVRDLQNNVIAPNSVIGVSWPINVNTNVLDFGAAWEYHTDWALGDPTIYQQPWYALDYNTATNGHWGAGCGVFFHDQLIDPGSYVPCAGMLNPFCSLISSYVRNPTLFRTSFVVPTNLATNVTLRISRVVDDGYVMYLNGTELAPRVNVAAGLPVDENLRAQAEYPDGQCSSNNLSVVLRPGTNVVAVAVCQYVPEGANGGDIYFAMRLDVTQTSILRTGPVPANGSPVRLVGTRVGDHSIRFTWPTNIYNYALEFTTNITRVGQNTVVGPWYQAQTNMAIGMETNYPFPASGSGPAYIFRLHKVP